MKYRKLRIAWSVGCMVACVFLLRLASQSFAPLPYIPVGGFGLGADGGYIHFTKAIVPPNSTERAYFDGDGLYIPITLLVLALIVGAASPWIRWRARLSRLSEWRTSGRK